MKDENYVPNSYHHSSLKKNSKAMRVERRADERRIVNINKAAESLLKV